MPVDSKVGRRHWGWLILLVTFWKFQHFNLVSKIFQKLFKPLPCHKSIGKMMHAICISAVAVSLRWASCGPWASCLEYLDLYLMEFVQIKRRVRGKSSFFSGGVSVILQSGLILEKIRRENGFRQNSCTLSQTDSKNILRTFSGIRLDRRIALTPLERAWFSAYSALYLNKFHLVWTEIF